MCNTAVRETANIYPKLHELKLLVRRAVPLGSGRSENLPRGRFSGHGWCSLKGDCGIPGSICVCLSVLTLHSSAHFLSAGAQSNVTEPLVPWSQYHDLLSLFPWQLNCQRSSSQPGTTNTRHRGRWKQCLFLPPAVSLALLSTQVESLPLPKVLRWNITRARSPFLPLFWCNYILFSNIRKIWEKHTIVSPLCHPPSASSPVIILSH